MEAERVAPDASAGAARKADHLRVALHEDVAHRGLTTGLDELRLRATALPDIDLDDVDTTTAVLGRTLGSPILISCMTGGTSEAGSVNAALAEAAQTHRVALGLGSGRVLLEGGDPTSFQVRDLAPDVLLLANLGAVQLPLVGIDGCLELLGRTQADVLVLHLNAIQEAVQPMGDTTFAGVLDAIAEVCAALSHPVVVKEVGFGMAAEDIVALAQAGVAGIDIAGGGGTNWATVEGHRDSDAGLVAGAFADWGWSTTDSLRAATSNLTGPDRPLLIASGGLRHGVDAVKTLCLGADLAGFGRRLLGPAAAGPTEANRHLGALARQVRIATWGVGAPACSELSLSHLVQRR